MIDRFSRAPGAVESSAQYPLTLVVELDEGIFVRHVPDATPLRPELSQGDAAEEAAHDAASIWGMPDFVYRAALQHRGSGTREVGDGIVIAGDNGLVVQVKSRVSASDDEEKERRWIKKKSAQALSQANGSIRALTQVESIQLTNRRGRVMAVDAREIQWTPVVVIDHHKPPDGVVPDLAGGLPAVALLRRDWEFLFEQLKSTSAVIDYFKRVAGDALELGDEPSRYYDLAQADAQAPPGKINEAIFGGRGYRAGGPVLPLQPMSVEAGRLVRLILEDVAVFRADSLSEEDRLRMLAEVDRLPVAHREATGKFLIDALREVAPITDGTAWRLRQMVGADETTLLGFGACSRPFDDFVEAAFRAWLILRHHQLQTATGKISELTSTGVLLTPRYDGKRRWDTTVASISGELEFTDDELAGFESVWGQPGVDRVED